MRRSPNPRARSRSTIRPAPAWIRSIVAAAALGAAAAVPGADPGNTVALPESPSPKYMQSLHDAQDAIAKRDLGGARGKLEPLVAERPHEPRARFLLGVVETDEGKTDAAIATFSALIREYPELPEPYNNLAVIHAERGEFEAARAALETAVRTAPEWAVAHENLGDVYARLAAGEYDRAAKLDRASRSAAAKLSLARNLIVSGAAAKANP